MASKRVSKKASILDPILNLFVGFGGPRGGGGASKRLPKIASKTALALKLGLCTPGSSPGAHLDPLGPRFWNFQELIFEARPLHRHLRNRFSVLLVPQAYPRNLLEETYGLPCFVKVCLAIGVAARRASEDPEENPHSPATHYKW